MSTKSVNQLAKKLANTAISQVPKGKKKQPVAVKPKSKRKARPRGGNVQNLGTMRIRDRELLCSITEAGTTVAYPGLGPENAAKPPDLAAFLKMFSRIKYHSLKIWWVGSSGMSAAGSIILAWDVGSAVLKPNAADLKKVTRQMVAGIQPNACFAGYENASNRPLSLSPAALQGSVGTGWFQVTSGDIGDSIPAVLFINSNGVAVGDVWIEYDVSLSGLHT